MKSTHMYPKLIILSLRRENNASFTKELTAVIENFNARNNSFSSEANGFLASLNTITNKLGEAEKTLESHHNNFVEFRPNLHQSKLLLKFFKMIWPNVMQLSEEPISINKVCPMNLKLMNLNWKVLLTLPQLQLVQALLLEVPIYWNSRYCIGHQNPL